MRLEKRLQQILENSAANITASDLDLDMEESPALTNQVARLEEEKVK